MASHPYVGDKAPDFTLPSTQGDVTLSQRLANGPVLLVFYPGDDTPVCTKQLCDYRDNLAVFSELGVQVIALNRQPLASHEKFAKKHTLPFPVAADEDGKCLQALRRVGPLRDDEARAGAGRSRRSRAVAQDRLPALLRKRRRNPRRHRHAGLTWDVPEGKKGNRDERPHAN